MKQKFNIISNIIVLLVLLMLIIHYTILHYTGETISNFQLFIFMLGGILSIKYEINKQQNKTKL